MRTTAAARRYAKALFSIAEESDGVAQIRAELTAIGEMVEESKELTDVLLTPLHPVEERKRVLATLCRDADFSDTVRNFLAFLVDQRLKLIDMTPQRAGAGTRDNTGDHQCYF